MSVINIAMNVFLVASDCSDIFVHSIHFCRCSGGHKRVKRSKHSRWRGFVTFLIEYFCCKWNYFTRLSFSSATPEATARCFPRNKNWTYILFSFIHFIIFFFRCLPSTNSYWPNTSLILWWKETTIHLLALGEISKMVMMMMMTMIMIMVMKFWWKGTTIPLLDSGDIGYCCMVHTMYKEMHTSFPWESLITLETETHIILS